MVDDVVVEQRGVVEHLHGHGQERGAAAFGLAEGVGGKQQQPRAQHLAHARGDVLLDEREQGTVGERETAEVFVAYVGESNF